MAAARECMIFSYMKILNRTGGSVVRTTLHEVLSAEQGRFSSVPIQSLS